MATQWIQVGKPSRTSLPKQLQRCAQRETCKQWTMVFLVLDIRLMKRDSECYTGQ